MDVVIPIADEQSNLTLPLALKSIAKYAPQLRTVALGNTMPHSKPYGPIELSIRFDQPAGMMIENTDKAMMLACLDERISDPFIWTNDDIYWRRPVSLEEMIDLSGVALGTLAPAEPLHPALGIYGRVEAMTNELLTTLGLPIYNYERHTPVLVHKTEMLHALELGGSKRSTYGNLMRPQPTRIALDVKMHKEWDAVPDIETEPFVSTSSVYPPELLPAMLGL